MFLYLCVWYSKILLVLVIVICVIEDFDVEHCITGN